MTDLTLLWVIQLAPLAAFLLIQLSPKPVKPFGPALGIAGALIAALASVQLFLKHAAGHGLSEQFTHTWLVVANHALFAGSAVDNYTLVVGFLLDPLNLLMITIVTSISFFVQLFSFYYMQEDPSRPRYFGFLSFFTFTMTGLVLSNNLLQTFLFWELVGLASYLLIGFWYEKQSAATAARKAFVINRVGDLGFYLGVIVLFLFLGTVNFPELNNTALLQTTFSPALLTALGLLIFMGVMGKSAQFPFHNWLPDAMEGPTPVSALIHSATMVAAGVFLLARSFNLFAASETTLFVILVTGTLTALIGAALATSQTDIKKILAYSTISQLGFMVMAMGAGSYVAGIFHLSTHAYFKSLLFLTAGVFIHHYHTNELWEIAGKGGRQQKLAMITLCVGLFALSGLFPFAGFFSKDMILEVLKEKSPFFYGAAILVSFLTVYYSFRMLFVLIFSKAKAPDRDAHPEGPLVKTARALPLVFLALLSFYVGFSGSVFGEGRLLHWLGGHDAHLNKELLLVTLALVAGGAGLAFFRFRNPEKAYQNLQQEKNIAKTVLDRKFFVDELYEVLVKKISLRFAGLLHWFDRRVVNDLLVNETSFSVKRLGKVLAKLQSGLLQDYLTLALGAGVIALLYFLNSRGVS